jgi:hypothetical protein
VNAEYKPDSCCKARLLYSSVIRFLIFATFLATSSLSYAAANSLNELQTAAPGYTSENAIGSISFAQLKAVKSDSLNNAQLNNNLFGEGQYIGSLSFDLTPASDASEFRTDNVFVNNELYPIDLATSSANSGTGESGLTEADMPTQFQVSRIEPSDNDWVKWNNSRFSQSGSLTSEYLHLPEIIAKYPDNAQPIIAYPVPEPDTYAMILAGLILIAFTARRRNIGYSN